MSAPHDIPAEICGFVLDHIGCVLAIVQRNRPRGSDDEEGV
jgi:hypothetical protein